MEHRGEVFSSTARNVVSGIGRGGAQGGRMKVRSKDT